MPVEFRRCLLATKVAAFCKKSNANVCQGVAQEFIFLIIVCIQSTSSVLGNWTIVLFYLFGFFSLATVKVSYFRMERGEEADV